MPAAHPTGRWSQPARPETDGGCHDTDRARVLPRRRAHRLDRSHGRNCASFGCPNLAPVAYTASNLDRLLTEGAVAYVNHPRGAELRKGRVRVSSIYAWFEEDLGGSRIGILEHLRQYARGDLAKALETYDGPLDDFYDWALNEP